jgi:4-amino-4-deoxy-L-arabinose transferase-like glycosyltransferase
MLSAALVGVSVACLVRWIADPTSLRVATVLGLTVGLAALTKFNALVAVATCGVVFAAEWRRRPERRPLSARSAALAMAIAAALSGWYFVQNVSRHGTPFPMQSEVVTRVMRLEGYGPLRPLADFVALDVAPLLKPGSVALTKRPAVWPATFASTWFDSFGTTLHVHASWGQRFGRGLYLLGALLTVATAVGAWMLWRRRVSLAVAGSGLALGTLAIIALATYTAFVLRVATNSALKGSYLSPGFVAFVVSTGIGLETLARLRPSANACVRALVVTFVVSVTAISWVGWLAPMPLNPADWSIRAYRDAATLRVYELFVTRTR